MVLRPRVGFRPTRPQHAAGARIEPKPSEACAAGSMRAPTAAAAPPLEPPDMRVRSQGFFVAPCNRGSQVRLRPSSQVLVRPKITTPARFKPLDQFAVFRRHDVFEELRAPGGRAAGKGSAEVLQEIGHALERPVRQAVGDGLTAMIVELVGDRVDGIVARADPLDRGFQQFLRSGFAAGYQRGQSERIMVFVVRESGHRIPLSMRDPEPLPSGKTASSDPWRLPGCHAAPDISRPGPAAPGRPCRSRCRTGHEVAVRRGGCRGTNRRRRDPLRGGPGGGRRRRGSWRR